MEDRYRLTLSQNVFLARKLISETIYNTARLEGCNITFPQTETILNGVSVAGVRMEDVEKVLNLRDAWKFVLSTVEEPLVLEYWNKVNGYVARGESLEWGVLRYGDVGISGTSYRPPLPVAEDICNKIDEITSSNKSDTEKALDLFLYGCRSQNYWDGNKRTSTIIANKYMIQKGVGIMSIPADSLEEFAGLLTDFYTTNESASVKQFLYDNAIRGMTIQTG